MDQATDEGEQVWRQIKANTAAFSIGGIFESRARTGGGREIYEVDLLEVSATSTPVHGATRVLYWKSMDADLPRELVGTAWDPLTATGGSEPWTEDRLAEHKSITARARPVRIASFPV